MYPNWSTVHWDTSKTRTLPISVRRRVSAGPSFPALAAAAARLLPEVQGELVDRVAGVHLQVASARGVDEVPGACLSISWPAAAPRVVSVS